MADIELIRPRLTGANFTRLLKSKKTKKYRVARDCNISWQTLRNWELNKSEPEEERALRVAIYLGLVGDKETEKLELKKELDALEKRIQRLE